MSDEEDDSFNDDFGDWDDEPQVPIASAGGTEPLSFNLGASLVEIRDEKSPESTDFTILTERDIDEKIHDLEREVAQALNVPVDQASFLLRIYNWSKDQLMENWLEDSFSIMKRNGLHLAVELPSSHSETEIECPICLDDVPTSQSFSLGCGHWFCRTCFEYYLEDQVKTKAEQCVLSSCPEQKCSVKVTDAIVSKLLQNPVLDSYKMFRRRHYLETQRRIKWCPGPGCSMAVVANKGLSVDHTHVSCSKCRYRWCFVCYQECHAPITCIQLKMWLEKCAKESETAHWIISNTRKCPKCHRRIEKNHGCNHMICTKCKYEFCWVCMGDWKEHGLRTGGYYKCNKYKAKKEVQQGPRTMAKEELDRFLHFYHRFHNHDQAKEFAGRTLDDIQQQMNKMHQQDSATSWVQVEFMKEAAIEVQKCRRILKYTYVYGYNLRDHKSVELFEFMQEDLEKNTEHLHGLLTDPNVGISDRDEIENFTRITRKFANELLQGLQGGPEKLQSSPRAKQTFLL